MGTLSLLKEIIDACFWPYYLLRNKPPWRLGYFTQKKKIIQDSIRYNKVDSDKLPKGYGKKIDERVIEYPWVIEQLNDKRGRLLDAGSSLNYRYLLDEEWKKKFDLTIMTLAPEKRFFNDKNISYLYGDLRNIAFKDSYFDVIISISTIEHVGLNNTLLYTNDFTKNENTAGDYTAVLKEFKRIIKPNGFCFITVPYGKPVIKDWYQVFGREQLQRAINNFSPKSYETAFFKYTEEGWATAKEEDLARAEFFDVHEHRTFDPDYAAGARGLLCLTLRA